MPYHKLQKINFNEEYPCPCYRRGRLLPIALTDAFGCQRCQQIFVVDQSGYTIEPVATHYPYKQSWQWTGTQWQKVHVGLKMPYLPLALVIVLLLLILWLPLAWQSPSTYIMLLAMTVVLLALLPALMIWLAQRR